MVVKNMDTLVKKVSNIERKVETMETEVILQMDKSEEIASNLNKVTELVPPKNLSEATVSRLNNILNRATAQPGQNENDEAGSAATEDGAQAIKTWASLFQTEANRMPPKEELENIVKKSMVQQERETLEREDRGKNVMLYGVEESKENDAKKREAADTEYVRGFLEAIKTADIKVEKVIRLGAAKEHSKNESPEQERPRARPIKFRVETLDQKEAIMSSLYNLKNAEEKYKAVAVRHDLTQTQREELKKKIAEAKRLTEESEDSFFLVRTKKGPFWEPFVVKTRKKTMTR
jgi:hypothetical protein